MHIKSAEATSHPVSSALTSSVSSPTAAPPPIGAAAKEPGSFSRLLNRLGSEIDRGESVVRGASKGTSVSSDPNQLIALQAGIYRYVEAVDLASKLVDRATNGVKTVLQSQ